MYMEYDVHINKVRKNYTLTSVKLLISVSFRWHEWIYNI
jgi:hypothetical protein